MFTVLVAATSIGIMGTVARLFTTSINSFIAVTVIKYAGIGMAPIFFLFVALLYDGKNHWVTRRTVTALLILPVLTLFVIATIQGHELFYTSFSTSNVGSLAAISVPGVGPWYWLFLVYDWGAIAIGTLILIFAAINRSAFYRYQLAFLLPAVSISWAANIAYAVYSWPHPVLDPTAVGFAVADALLAFGIFTTQLIDITPSARSLVLDTIDDSVIVIDPNDRVVDINDAARSLIESEEIIGKPSSDVLPSEILQVDTADTSTIQLTVDSRHRFYRHRQLPIGPDGTHGTVIVLTEITTEKESQQQIEEAHDQLRQIIDLIPDPLFVKNIDDEVLLSNEANADLLGSTPEEVEGTPEPEAMPDVQNYEQYRQRDIEVIETGNSTVFEEKLTSADGETHIFQTTRIPFETAGESEDAVLGYARDVTELKEYEQELEALNTRLQLALAETDTGVWEWNLDTDEVVWDEASEQLYGYDPGEFPGTFEGFTDRIHDEDLPTVRDAIDAAIERGDEYRADFRVKLPDGNQRWLQTRGVVKYDAAGEPHRMVGIQTDITERKERERRVEQARKSLRQVVDLVPDPLFAKNLDDEVLLSNEANAELHGMTPEEIEGTRERDIESDIENIENFDKYRQREMEVVETGESRTFEEQLMDPDGETRIFKTTRIPFETAGDDEDAVLGYARDVTDLKEYEQELDATKDRLEQTNEELETLNRVLRHDIRNDAVVQSRLGERLKEYVDEGGDEYLEQLLARGEHIADITTSVRTLMQTMLDDQQDLSAVRLDTILEAEIENATAAYEEATVRIASDIPQVSVQADQILSSVFQNLLENAIQHNNADIPAVAVSAAERDETVVVRVADNGPGVPADIADELFAKGEKGLESKGTGIGLYLVTKLLDKYGGDIWVENNPAKEGCRADGSQDIPDTDGEWNETFDGAVFAVELRKETR